MTETPHSETEVSTDSKTLETEGVDEAETEGVDEAEMIGNDEVRMVGNDEPASGSIEYASDEEGPDVRRLVAWAGLGVLSLLVLVAFAGFYSSVGTIIDLWIEPRHQPIMRAAFNLAVLLVALAGVSVAVRELSAPTR